MNNREAINRILEETQQSAERDLIVDFIRTSARGIVRAVNWFITTDKPNTHQCSGKGSAPCQSISFNPIRALGLGRVSEF